MLKLKSLIAKIRDGARAVLSAIVSPPFVRRASRVSQCAVIALAIAVIPAARVAAHSNSALHCMSVTAINGGWRVVNVCSFDIRAGWCVHSGGGCAIDPDGSTQFRSLLNPNESETVSSASGGNIQYAACLRDGGSGVRSEDYPGSVDSSQFTCAHTHTDECGDNNGNCRNDQTCTDTNLNDIGGVFCCAAGTTYRGGVCVADTSGGGGANSCQHANDGECDDGNYAVHETSLCSSGTDENDCRAVNSGGPVVVAPPPPSSGGGGGGGGDDGGSDNTWLYIGGGVAAVILLVAVSGGFSAAPDITPIVEYSPDGQIYGARLEVSAPQQSGAMWWEYREFHGGHSQNHSVKFGGDWADSGLFASGAIEEGDAGIDWRASGGKKWESGQWGLHSGVDAAGFGQFGRIPKMSLQMSVKYAADGWWTTSGLNVSADKPSDAEVEVRTEWNF